TLDVAKAFGAKIGHFEWNADFSAARNASLRLAEGAWALWLDADERLTRESWSELFEAIVRPHFAGFALPILNFYRSEGDQEHAYHAPIRL
ncbi:glycosyltransferase, partial [Acinetobacter baumannii]